MLLGYGELVLILSVLKTLKKTKKLKSQKKKKIFGDVQNVY